MTRLDVLVKGLQKAVKDPDTEWVDANIIRLLLDEVAKGSAEVPVGWYCPGGHRNHKDELVRPSIRLDDPCAYGVPVYTAMP